jgi:hypothetical protein
MIILFSSTLFQHVCPILLVNFKKKIKFLSVPWLLAASYDNWIYHWWILKSWYWRPVYGGTDMMVQVYHVRLFEKGQYKDEICNQQASCHQVRIGPPHPLLCRKSLRGDWMRTPEDPGMTWIEKNSLHSFVCRKRLNRAVLQMKPEKSRPTVAAGVHDKNPSLLYGPEHRA